MAAVNAYASLAELKERLGHQTTEANDAILDQVLEAASRQIDGMTNRRFYLATETRHYTAEWGDCLFIDDLTAVTTLKTDEDGDRVYETTWLTTDYDLEPFNASFTGAPFTRIRVTPNGSRSFPTIRRGVEIVGTWGYATGAIPGSAPDAITEACLLLSVRLYQRKNAPFGVAGSTELGQVTLLPHKNDPDVLNLVSQYRRITAGAV